MSTGTVIDVMSAIVVLFALVSGATTFASTGRLGIALAVLVDLLTAAGLLHLAADPDYIRALSAAIVLGVRHLVSWSLSNAGRPQTSGKSGVGRRSAQLVRVLTASPMRGLGDDLRPRRRSSDDNGADSGGDGGGGRTGP